MCANQVSYLNEKKKQLYVIVSIVSNVNTKWLVNLEWESGKPE